MALFSYKGRLLSGESKAGTLEAQDVMTAMQMLKAEGVHPLDIKPAVEDIKEDQKQSVSFFKPTKVKDEDLILFSRQMYTLLHAGVPITKSIRRLSESALNPTLKSVLQDVSDRLEGGMDLATACKQHDHVFSPLYISLLHVGENTGQLDQAFLQIADYIERDENTRKKVKQALRYPSMVFGALIVAFIIMNVFVIPSFESVFSSFKAELPWATKILISTSTLCTEYGHWVILCIMIMSGVFVYWKNTPNGQYALDKSKLKWPIFGGLIHRAMMARFTRSFATLLQSGVPLIQSLGLVSYVVDNVYVGERIRQMREQIARGDALSNVAGQSGLFSNLVLQMLVIGEETGAVDKLLLEVAGSYERDIEYELKRLSDLIEPIMIVAVGILVMILALGIFLPMWELSGTVQ